MNWQLALYSTMYSTVLVLNNFLKYSTRTGITMCDARLEISDLSTRRFGPTAMTLSRFEVFGGAAPEAMSLLASLGHAARSKTPPGEEPPWSQLLSMFPDPCRKPSEAPPLEILNRVDGEAAHAMKIRIEMHPISLKSEFLRRKTFISPRASPSPVRSRH